MNKLEKILKLGKNHEVKVLENIIDKDEWIVALFYKRGKKKESQIILEGVSKEEAEKAANKFQKQWLQ